MRSEIWSAHVWMQTVSAYPNGPQPTEPCHLERVRKLIRSDKPDAWRTLVVGPGTAAEIAQAKAVFEAETLTAMTLSADEVGPIRAAGHECRIGDVHDAPFLNEAFDLIFSSNVFEHALAPHVALLECRRMLRLHGTFYAIVPTFETPGGGCTPWHLYCFNEALWRELCRKAGLQVSHFERVSETLAGGAVEHYYHIRAIAVEPPTPHDEVLRRISELKQ